MSSSHGAPVFLVVAVAKGEHRITTADAATPVATKVQNKGGHHIVVVGRKDGTEVECVRRIARISTDVLYALHDEKCNKLVPPYGGVKVRGMLGMLEQQRNISFHLRGILIFSARSLPLLELLLAFPEGRSVVAITINVGCSCFVYGVCVGTFEKGRSNLPLQEFQQPPKGLGAIHMVVACSLT